MRSFALVIEYLTGYAVATNPSNREQAEWPPHPARVFMALAAAHFETDGPLQQKQVERAALEWLAARPPPDMQIPDHTLRQSLNVYVPVNDQPGGEALIRRSRQPRFFPRVYVGDEPLRLVWHFEGVSCDSHLDALEAVCRNVTRIGHSSSLVRVRVMRDATGLEVTHVPDDYSIDHRLRVLYDGAMARLEQSFNATATAKYDRLREQTEAAKGNAKKELKPELEQRYPGGRPESQRPTFSTIRGYRALEPILGAPSASAFDPNFIVLREHDDAEQSFGLESTAQITNALRNLIMSKSPQPVPDWVSGHADDGTKLESGSHMALVPLAFVGGEHADGHLMGVGILIPRDIPLRERARVFSSFLFDEKTADPKALSLTLGKAGVWIIERETSFSPKQNLQPLTYTAANRSWASVTPVVLDRMAKADRTKDPIAWREEVAAIVAQSCANVGLPQPIAVRVEKTPFFRGSLRAMPGQGGFSQLRPGRFQVHIQIEFERPVSGPMLLGAGRFRGYGLMRPWQREEGR